MTFLATRKVVPTTAAKKQLAKYSKPKHRSVLLSYKHKQQVIGALTLVNAIIVGVTINQSPNLHLQGIRAVEASMAPSASVQTAEIRPIAAPQALITSIEAEKVEPTPTPTPMPATAVAGVSISRPAPNVSNWDGLLQQYFGGNWVYAKRIMLCESSGNASAVGPTDSQGYNPIGLFQIKNFAGRPSTQALMDAVTNIQHAAKMSGGGSNWSAWECR